MKSEGSLAHSQVPANRTYPEPRQSSLRLINWIFKFHFSITVQSTAKEIEK